MEFMVANARSKGTARCTFPNAEEEGNGGHRWKAQFVVCHDGVWSLRETQSAIDEDAGRDKVDSKRQAELVKHVKEKAV